MTVYLGDSGAVQIKRKSGAPISGQLLPGDVVVSKKRFGVTGQEIQGALITGDQVDIRRNGGGNLVLVEGHDFPDWRGYVFIDQLGGIRLFETFAESLDGNPESALELEASSSAQSITITTRNSGYNYLGEVTGYEITTERDTVDITQLGNQFKQQYEAGLISGQGRLDCFFEYKKETCDEGYCPAGTEYSIYLAQLCIRLTQGADFIGRYYIYRPPTPGNSEPTASKQAVWYDAECLVTNCTISVTATQAIEASIDFVTTGPVKLLTGAPRSFLLQEDSSFLLLEQQQDFGRIVLAGQDV